MKAGRGPSLLTVPTRDPFTGGDVVVTSLECVESGTRIEGRFDLGWIGRLDREQLEFVGLLLRYRNNLQRLAAELHIAYNTARSRFDDIVAALEGAEPVAPRPEAEAERRASILDRLAAHEISVEEAAALLSRRPQGSG